MKYARAILVTIAVGVLLDILIDVMIPDGVMNVVFVIVTSVVLLGCLLVAVGTIRKNRWGINLEPVNCPSCGSPMPRVRQPKSQTQALWGGWNCAKCGREIDKWGRLSAPQDNC
jgi:DNA-directed RNA polymerase subunit RPC12/RpoP